ncbi:MAG: HD domain-containing protein [Candidatus Korobacteraceae bacterium]|jgi:putative hydrolase of HD superfamily
MNRLDQQLSFVLEIDKLKTILRQTLLTDSSRRENSAEHSWHLAIMSFLLAEYSPEPVEILRVMKMLLVHDLIEIDAGDTFAYDVAGNLGRAEREQRCAERIFGMLPVEQGRELRALWEEFDAFKTPESKYANALDRLQPLLHNSRTEGGTWRIHSVTLDQVHRRMEPIRTALPELWPVVTRIIEDACARGWIVS